MSAGDQNVLISIIAAPRAGSTGTMVVSAPSTQLAPPDAGSFNCDVNLSDDSVLDCFGNASGGSGKIADADAEVEFTVTVSGDAGGSFGITSFDDTFSDGPGDGDELATTDVRVAAPTTTTSTTTTTTIAATTTTTAAVTTTTVAATTTTAATTSTTVAGILSETGECQRWLALAASAATVAGAGALLVSRRKTASTS